MSVGESVLYLPKLNFSPSTPPVHSLKPRLFIPNPIPPKAKAYPQFLPQRIHLHPGQRDIVVRTMDGEGDDDDKSEAEGNGALEQEEVSSLIVGSSRFPSPTVRTGLQPTLNRLSKWLLAGLFTAAIVWRHDAESLWAAMGSVLNSALSVVLKRILNQQRPNSAISSSPGMPSSHAQSIFYITVFIIWSLIQRLQVTALSLVLSTLTLAFGSYLSWLRVTQRYHTMSQVGVGAAVGSGFAFLWLWAWQAFVVHAFTSYLWVKLVVVVGSFLFCLGFLVHVIRDWLPDYQ